MTIYIDVLIIINTYVNFFLLKATSKFSHAPITLKRNIIAAFAGSFTALCILLPEMPLLLIFLIKAVCAAFIVFIGFGKKNLLKLTFIFLSINFIFAGIMLGLQYLPFTSIFYTENMNSYVDLSLLNLIVFTIIAYVVLSFIRRDSDREVVDGCKYEIYIQNEKATVKCTAIADTGNTASDLSGKPIVFIDKIGGMKLLGSDVSKYTDDCEKMFRNFKIKLIPCSTINGNGLIPAFKPREVIIKEILKNKVFKVDVIIGIIDSTDETVIFNPKILI
jgi:stage II sporulation protein GA (sporulation sigma-E factor processing peptidase)